MMKVHKLYSFITVRVLTLLNTAGGHDV